MIEIAAASPPRSAVYDVLLLLHILVAIGVIVTMASAYAAAMAIGKVRAGDPWPESAARYFRPGPDVVGRVLYLVPITGFVLLSLSQHAFSLATPFVGIGLALWILAVVIAECFIFRPSARLARVVASSPSAPDDDTWRHQVPTVRWSVDAVLLLVVAGSVVMLVQP